MCLFANWRLLVMVGVTLLAITPGRSAPPCPDPLLRPDEPPHNDGICADRGGVQNFAHLAWRAFTMLVWPAADGSRGKPDENRPITDMSGARVFETYKSDWEVFPTIPPGTKWDTYPSEATFCNGYVPARAGRLPDGSLVLGALDKFESVAQPGGAIAAHVLMAQNGSLVRYLAAFNEKAFDLIKNLPRSLNLPVSEADPIDDQRGKTKAEDGTITVKSAWIEITNSTPDPGRFHVRSAWVQDPSGGECRQAKVGLVGLHIVHKSESSQQWVWASFEHVRNAPLRGTPPAAGFTFNNGSGLPMPFAPPLDSRTKPPSLAAPYNVERLYEIDPDIKRVNGIWQQALQGSVWSNYQLVVVQWPSEPQMRVPPTTLFGQNRVNPAPPCIVTQPKTSNTANSVMETFLQSTPGTASQDALTCPTDEKNMGNTCMGCHYQAHNYDFIWGIALNRASGDTGADARNRASAFSTLRKITGWSTR